jgi:hypothetical protein
MLTCASSSAISFDALLGGFAACLPGSVSPGLADEGKPLLAPTGVGSIVSMFAPTRLTSLTRSPSLPRISQAHRQTQKKLQIAGLFCNTNSQISPQYCLKNINIFSQPAPQEPHQESPSPVNP